MNQLDLYLSARPTDEVLRERLAEKVEALNSSTDPDERVRLHTEVVHLRRLLRQERAS